MFCFCPSHAAFITAPGQIGSVEVPYLSNSAPIQMNFAPGIFSRTGRVVGGSPCLIPIHIHARGCFTDALTAKYMQPPNFTVACSFIVSRLDVYKSSNRAREPICPPTERFFASALSSKMPERSTTRRRPLPAISVPSPSTQGNLFHPMYV